MIPEAALEGGTNATLPMAPPNLVVEAMKVPLFVESFEAKIIEDDLGVKHAAYEVTLKGELPERFAAELLALVRNHRIVVVIQEDEGAEK